MQGLIVMMLVLQCLKVLWVYCLVVVLMLLCLVLRISGILGQFVCRQVQMCFSCFFVLRVVKQVICGLKVQVVLVVVLIMVWQNLKIVFGLFCSLVGNFLRLGFRLMYSRELCEVYVVLSFLMNVMVMFLIERCVIVVCWFVQILIFD